EWLEKDLKGRSASPRIVGLTHVPMWPLYPQWGWATEDAPQALAYLKRFGSVTVLNGHIHQVVQKVEGKVTYQTAMSTAFPAPKAGEGPGPAPLKVPAEQLRSVIGIREVAVAPSHPLVLTDITLAYENDHDHPLAAPAYRRCGRDLAARERRGAGAATGGQDGPNHHRKLQVCPRDADRCARHHRHLDQQGRRAAQHRQYRPAAAFPLSGGRGGRQVHLRLQRARHLQVHLRGAPAHGGDGRRQVGPIGGGRRKPGHRRRMWSYCLSCEGSQDRCVARLALSYGVPGGATGEKGAGHAAAFAVRFGAGAGHGGIADRRSHSARR